MTDSDLQPEFFRGGGHGGGGGGHGGFHGGYHHHGSRWGGGGGGRYSYDVGNYGGTFYPWYYYNPYYTYRTYNPYYYTYNVTPVSTVNVGSCECQPDSSDVTKLSVINKCTSGAVPVCTTNNHCECQIPQ